MINPKIYGKINEMQDHLSDFKDMVNLSELNPDANIIIRELDNKLGQLMLDISDLINLRNG